MSHNFFHLPRMARNTGTINQLPWFRYRLPPLSPPVPNIQSFKLDCVAALPFNDARATVLRQLSGSVIPPAALESIGFVHCPGRVLAEDIFADRDYPPFHRSMRDGFAIRATDLEFNLKIIGEVRAGQSFNGVVQTGEAVEIMTGAPMPQGADAVLMIEHAARNPDGTIAAIRKNEPNFDIRKNEPNLNVVPRGAEAHGGAILLERGTRLDYTSLACLASVGRTSIAVFPQPRVAILATGDELVEPHETPNDAQIRNSNACSLAAQVTRAGGIPVILPIARDTKDQTRALIEQGLDSDLLLLSGGVSAGRYDIVEPVLADLGAEFFFDRVLIQPGQPVVFGRARSRFFFGLPGNPISTMVTFEVFARAAIQLLGGASDTSLPLSLARLTVPFHHKAGLTRFLPALLSGGEITPVASKGSGDIAALARANCFLMADPAQPEYAAGDLIPVLPK
jgi:molybdopterin molybdotransferase